MYIYIYTYIYIPPRRTEVYRIKTLTPSAARTITKKQKIIIYIYIYLYIYIKYTSMYIIHILYILYILYIYLYSLIYRSSHVPSATHSAKPSAPSAKHFAKCLFRTGLRWWRRTTRAARCAALMKRMNTPWTNWRIRSTWNKWAIWTIEWCSKGSIGLEKIPI